MDPCQKTCMRDGAADYKGQRNEQGDISKGSLREDMQTGHERKSVEGNSSKEY